MINFLLASLLFFVSGFSYAQLQDVVPGKYTPGFYSVQNFIKNPNCFANTRNISTTATGAIARTTSSPLEGPASCSLSGTATADKVIFSGRIFDKALSGQNCELKFAYLGNASKWKVYAQSSSIAVSQSLQLEDSGTTPKLVSILYPCGDASAAVDIAFESTGTPLPSFKVTSVYTGLATNMASVSQAKLLGVVKVTGCSTYWTGPTTSYASFTAQTGCVYTTEGLALAPSTNIPAIRFATLAAGDYVIEYNGMADSAGTNDQPFFQFFDGTNTTRESDAPYTNSSHAGTPIIRQSISYTAAQSNVTLQLRAKMSTGSPRVAGTTAIPGVFKVWYFPPASQVVLAPSMGNKEVPCSFSTLAWQGLGTVTNNLRCKKQGGDLLIEGRFTVGTPAAAQLQIPLPLWDGASLAVKGASVLTGSNSGIQIVGRGSRNFSTASGNDLSVIVTAAATYLTMGIYNNGATEPYTQQNGSSILTSADVVTINARVPIQGWDDQTYITGSLVDEVTSTGSGSGADIQGVHFGSGADCTTACSTGTCTICHQTGTRITSVTFTATGQYRVNGIDGTKHECIGAGFGSTVNRETLLQERAGSTSTYALMTSDGPTNLGYNSVICFGKP
jgi:hypothetical protein